MLKIADSFKVKFKTHLVTDLNLEYMWRNLFVIFVKWKNFKWSTKVAVSLQLKIQKYGPHILRNKVPLSESILDIWITRQSEAKWLFYSKHSQFILFNKGRLCWIILAGATDESRKLMQQIVQITNELKVACVNFINVKRVHFLYERHFGSFSSYM